MYYYLSNPYNGTEIEKQQRAEICAEVCFHFIKRKIPVISPIVHNHSIYQHPDIAPEINKLSGSERFDLIMGFDLALLKSAKAMLLLQLPGWQQSKGVAAELEFCQQNNIPVITTTAENYRDIELK